MLFDGRPGRRHGQNEKGKRRRRKRRRRGGERQKRRRRGERLQLSCMGCCCCIGSIAPSLPGRTHNQKQGAQAVLSFKICLHTDLLLFHAAISLCRSRTDARRGRKGGRMSSSAESSGMEGRRWASLLRSRPRLGSIIKHNARCGARMHGHTPPGWRAQAALHISSIITQRCLVHSLATLCLLSFVICCILHSAGTNGHWSPKYVSQSQMPQESRSEAAPRDVSL
ncbi:unnamed protein product [Pleuronectes platessa]|uniref:Uncharacterized protein n=1 Tax=Pleuronectes platessa TaxID=8262 RepID=A0A9N7W0K1_PLEPL|nr:unnamed protein product [Pleuronectes platessa]